MSKPPPIELERPSIESLGIKWYLEGWWWVAWYLLIRPALAIAAIWLLIRLF